MVATPSQALCSCSVNHVGSGSADAGTTGSSASVIVEAYRSAGFDFKTEVLHADFSLEV
jgi:hypothetical protein